MPAAVFFVVNSLRDVAARRLARWVVQGISVAIVAPWLAGCTPTGSAILQTFTAALRPAPAAARPALNPRYRYLRVTTEGREALLVLGHLDQSPQGQVEVWFSAGREVLRLQGGRLVGASGLLTEWRQVWIPVLPTWRQMAAGHGWERTRDVMPGYRYGVRDRLYTQQIPPPPSLSLEGEDASSLMWFEERQLAPLPGPSLRLPPARFAVRIDAEGREAVVFGEQCLAPDLCLRWQYLRSA